MYFGGETGKRCYFGGKMGAYRVLSSVPNVESGWCIPLSDVDRVVFPAPNEDGSFDRSVCDAIEYRADRSFFVRLEYVQTGPEGWAIGHSLRVGDTRQASPAVVYQTYSTLEEAITQVLSPILRGLGSLAAGADNPFVKPHGKHTVLQRRARDAMYHLLNALSPHLQNAIVMSLLGRSGDSDG
jgi:hypothetical protein